MTSSNLLQPSCVSFFFPRFAFTGRHAAPNDDFDVTIDDFNFLWDFETNLVFCHSFLRSLFCLRAFISELPDIIFDHDPTKIAEQSSVIPFRILIIRDRGVPT